jgi:bifunctional non-homologous end joining protein LigD
VSPDRKASVTITVDGRKLTISNLDKVLYPATGFTKGDIIGYYAKVAEVMLPHVRDRPMTMRRFPDGVDGLSFFEKHTPAHPPTWLRHVSVPTTGDDSAVDYSMVSDLPALLWAANLATIEFHVPLWHVGRRRTLPGPPDHMVFDLDPGEGTTIVECCTVARHIVDVLAAQGLACFAKTSGSKGLQLYAPLQGRSSWDRSRDRTHHVALQLERHHPDLVVSTMQKSRRRNRVLIDWSQNHPAKTTVAAYSLRARSEPTVSTPVTWDEVHRCEESGDPALLRFTAPEVLDRIEQKGDLFAPVSDHR